MRKQALTIMKTTFFLDGCYNYITLVGKYSHNCHSLLISETREEAAAGGGQLAFPPTLSSLPNLDNLYVVINKSDRVGLDQYKKYVLVGYFSSSNGFLTLISITEIRSEISCGSIRARPWLQFATTGNVK